MQKSHISTEALEITNIKIKQVIKRVVIIGYGVVLLMWKKFKGNIKNKDNKGIKHVLAIDLISCCGRNLLNCH